ncbi:MAG TPA: hypothetical protein VMH89_13865 [Candidatus Acidoferrum sp.]|nr:hypothetical protein [Candidatus Acidoferrum sp.]
MPKKATAEQAQLILKLYDLRREPEMRKARNWWTSEFWPKSADDFLKIAWVPGTQENNWLRQVSGYWGIATSFVLQGVLSDELFLVPGFSGEMFVLFAKLHPFLGELRGKLGDPEAYKDIETVVNRTKWGRERLKFLLKRMQSWQERMTKKA